MQWDISFLSAAVSRLRGASVSNRNHMCGYTSSQYTPDTAVRNATRRPWARARLRAVYTLYTLRRSKNISAVRIPFDNLRNRDPGAETTFRKQVSARIRYREKVG